MKLADALGRIVDAAWLADDGLVLAENDKRELTPTPATREPPCAADRRAAWARGAVLAAPAPKTHQALLPSVWVTQPEPAVSRRTPTCVDAEATAEARSSTRLGPRAHSSGAPPPPTTTGWLASWAQQLAQPWSTHVDLRTQVAGQIEVWLGEAERMLVDERTHDTAAALYGNLVGVCRSQNLTVRATLLQATERHKDPLLLALQLPHGDACASVLLAASHFGLFGFGLPPYLAALEGRLQALGNVVREALLRGEDAAAGRALERLGRLRDAGQHLTPTPGRALGSYVVGGAEAGLAVALAEKYGCAASAAALLGMDRATAQARLAELEAALLDELRTHKLATPRASFVRIETLLRQSPHSGPPGIDGVDVLAAMAGSLVVEERRMGVVWYRYVELTPAQLLGLARAPRASSAALAGRHTSWFDVVAHLGASLRNVSVGHGQDAQNVRLWRVD